MPTLAKPLTPTWRPGQAARIVPGCKGFWFLNDTGATARDLSGNDLHGSIVGAASAIRNFGPYGLQIHDTDASNYVSLPPTPQVIATGFPFWMAGMATNTAVAAGDSPILCGGQTGGSQFCYIEYARFVAGDLAYEYRDSVGNTLSISYTPSPASNDGKPHVVMGVSYSGTDHRLYYDGFEVGITATSVSTNTFDAFSLGQRIAFGNPIRPFIGAIVCAAVGVGDVPNARTLADNWLSGRFAEARRKRRPTRAAFSAAAAGGPFPFYTRQARDLSGGMITMG